MGITPKKIGQKTLRVFPEAKGLNKWIDRPVCIEDAYPMKGALELYGHQEVRLDKKAKDAIGYLSATSNDVQHSKTTFTVSGVYGHGDGVSITPINITKAMVSWAVRLLISPSWTNDRDQFSQPNLDPLPENFILNCVVWSLFHGSNQTSSLKDVKYDGKTYQVRNQFFPYLLDEIAKWDRPNDLSGQFRSAKDTFVANWLKGRTLSKEAQELFDAGRKVYQVFYKEWNNLNRAKFKISYWDCGWYQIRNALLDAGVGLTELNTLKEKHTKLTALLQPKVYEYGFLDQEILYGT